MPSVLVSETTTGEELLAGSSAAAMADRRMGILIVIPLRSRLSSTCNPPPLSVVLCVCDLNQKPSNMSRRYNVALRDRI